LVEQIPELHFHQISSGVGQCGIQVNFQEHHGVVLQTFEQIEDSIALGVYIQCK